jgi:hypothetical protein
MGRVCLRGNELEVVSGWEVIIYDCWQIVEKERTVWDMT